MTSHVTSHVTAHVRLRTDNRCERSVALEVCVREEYKELAAAAADDDDDLLRLHSHQALVAKRLFICFQMSTKVDNCHLKLV